MGAHCHECLSEDRLQKDCRKCFCKMQRWTSNCPKSANGETLTRKKYAKSYHCRQCPDAVKWLMFILSHTC